MAAKRTEKTGKSKASDKAVKSKGAVKAVKAKPTGKIVISKSGGKAIKPKRIGKVVDLLKPYVRVSEKVGPFPIPEVPKYMFRLVKNDRTYKAFERDPEAAMKRAGIPTKSIDVAMFAGLAKMLHDRKHGRGILDHVAETVTSQETKTSQEINFDSSGRSTETTRGSHVGESTKFETSGIIKPDDILRHEINLLFFPSQPLVTPDLIERIKKIK
jgi:hypothetical protein